MTATADLLSLPVARPYTKLCIRSKTHRAGSLFQPSIPDALTGGTAPAGCASLRAIALCAVKSPSMNTLRFSALLLTAGLWAAGTVWAQSAAAPAAGAQAKPPAAALADTQPKSKYPEPLVRNQVTQDRSVRIQERQVRGATTEIHVQPLHGGAAYNVVPPDVSSSTDPANMQGRAMWKIGNF